MFKLIEPALSICQGAENLSVTKTGLLRKRGDAACSFQEVAVALTLYDVELGTVV